jgi:DNA mismatch repair protein MutS
MFRQYQAAKARQPDALLFFRMGDFYEMFYDDARIAARVLGLALTSRSKGENYVPMAGVPHHAVDSYLRRLIRAGYKVAICEQLEDPREAKGLVERDIVRVVTPGTLTEESMLEARTQNYLAAILPAAGGPHGPTRPSSPEAESHRGADGGAGAPRPSALAWVDLSTGEFWVAEPSSESLPDELSRIHPAECLLPESLRLEDERPAALADLDLLVTYRPDWTFSPDTGERELCRHFAVGGLEGFGCEGMTVALGAAGALLEYLRETQKTELGHLRKLTPYRPADFLILDRATQRSLELVETARERSAVGSLLWVLDETATAMGARLLRQWLLSPLTDPAAINRRLDLVQAFAEDDGVRTQVRAALRRSSDLERLAARLGCLRASPRDLLGLAQSLALVPDLSTLLSGSGRQAFAELAGGLDPVPEAHDLIAQAIDPQSPASLREGGVIRRGYSQELDDLRVTGRDGRQWLAEFQAREVQRTGISTLKVGYNDVFGYYIEVTHTHRERVPADYVRKQTLKNAERYVTPELREFGEKVLAGEERALELEESLFQEVRAQVACFTGRIQQTAQALARLDVLADLAEVARKNRYVRPVVDDSLVLDIADGRHPVLERTLTEERFVPNDTALDPASAQVAVITGPNMAGKSTYIRQVALILLMAQMGSFVPARSARVGVADRIFTRVGAADELARGRSTFMVEMTEAANILNNASARSLIVLDEIGRGTSTFDGLAIAWAASEYLHEHVGARTLFATHYHELTELELLLPRVKNFNVAVREWGDEVVFLHKILPGGTDKSYGIQVARLAGLPREVIDRAKTILANLEQEELDETARPKLARPQSGRPTRRGRQARPSPVQPEAGEGRAVGGGQAAGEGAGAAVAQDGVALAPPSPLGGHPVPVEKAGGVALAPPEGVPVEGTSEAEPPQKPAGPRQLPLFASPAEEVSQTLRSLNLDQLTPTEALQKLKELQEKAKGNSDLQPR